MLQLQAIRKVDQSGNEVLGPSGEPTLLRVVSIEHNYAKDVEDDSGINVLGFNPIKLEFEELKSVADISWSDTIQFNLLHFFRNFTAHRSLIACKTNKGYFNLETTGFEPADQNLLEPWILIAEGLWVLVPELRHLRQAGRTIPPTFCPHPLLVVCSSLLGFVENQRSNVLLVLDHKEDYPYVVNYFDDGYVTFAEKGQHIGRCRWEVAHLWPAVR